MTLSRRSSRKNTVFIKHVPGSNIPCDYPNELQNNERILSRETTRGEHWVNNTSAIIRDRSDELTSSLNGFTATINEHLSNSYVCKKRAHSNRTESDGSSRNKKSKIITNLNNGVTIARSEQINGESEPHPPTSPDVGSSDSSQQTRNSDTNEIEVDGEATAAKVVPNTEDVMGDIVADDIPESNRRSSRIKTQPRELQSSYGRRNNESNRSSATQTPVQEKEPISEYDQLKIAYNQLKAELIESRRDKRACVTAALVLKVKKELMEKELQRATEQLIVMESALETKKRRKRGKGSVWSTENFKLAHLEQYQGIFYYLVRKCLKRPL